MEITGLLEQDFGLSLKNIKLTIRETDNFIINNDYVREEKNPDLGIEIWRNSYSEIIKEKHYSFIKHRNCIEVQSDIPNSILYGINRSELTNIIRNDILSNSLFGLHAAFLSYKNQNLIILGEKGAGKTSASLYLYNKGAKFYTDELLIFKDMETIFTLGRKPSLDKKTLEKYFPMFKEKIFFSSKSILNSEEKKIIDIDMLKSQISQYKDFNDFSLILLTKNPDELTKEEILKKVAAQFITKNSVAKEDLKFFYNLLNKTCPMTIEEIKEL